MNQLAGQQSARLREVAGVFLKLGLTAFGGPAAHIGLMEQELVRRRAWLTHEEFLDLLGATNLIPGPNSTEMAIHLGHRRAGPVGLAVGGACFILPAALIVTAIAWVYVRFGALPQVGALLYGVKPVIIAIVVQALWSLSRAAVKSTLLALTGFGAASLSLFGVNELAVLFGAGFAVAALSTILRRQHRSMGSGSTVLVLGQTSSLPLLAVAAPAAPFTLSALFLFFLKTGSVLFGSGYVLLAFLRADLVEHWHWLNEGQLLDAIAVGQVTPGPVFTTATFIGYILAGIPGAATATIGIFLPAFFFVAISGPLIPRIRASRIAGAVLDGVNVASLALMAVVTWRLGNNAIVDWLTGLLALTAALLLIWWRMNSVWLVIGGGLVGLVKFLAANLR
jgi:chromate transporter